MGWLVRTNTKSDTRFLFLSARHVNWNYPEAGSCRSVNYIISFNWHGDSGGLRRRCCNNSFSKRPKCVWKGFEEIAKFGGALRLLTVGLVISTATFLTLADKIKGEAVVAILSGVAGYVLGAFQRSMDKPPSGGG